MPLVVLNAPVDLDRVWRAAASRAAHLLNLVRAHCFSHQWYVCVCSYRLAVARLFRLLMDV